MRLSFGPTGRSARCDILVVCTGNVCRSPYIAATLRSRLAGVVVTSAGTAALVGEPPTGPTLELLHDRHIDVGSDVARRLARRAVADAQLVLTAERSHRSAVLLLDRRADRRVFTVKELARLIAAGPVPTADSLDAVLEATALARVQDAAGEHDDDLDDPYQRGAAAYEAMAADADAALRIVVPVLARTFRQ